MALELCSLVLCRPVIEDHWWRPHAWMQGPEPGQSGPSLLNIVCKSICTVSWAGRRRKGWAGELLVLLEGFNTFKGTSCQKHWRPAPSPGCMSLNTNPPECLDWITWFELQPRWRHVHLLHQSEWNEAWTEGWWVKLVSFLFTSWSGCWVLWRPALVPS